MIRFNNLSKRVQAEVQIHLQLKHASVVELYHVFEDKNYVYLVMECCARGELFKYLVYRIVCHFTLVETSKFRITKRDIFCDKLCLACNICMPWVSFTGI